MSFIAATLLLATAGAFAGRAKFNVSGLYLIDGSGAVVQTITNSSLSFFTTTQSGSATTATIIDQNNNPLTFATDVSGTKVAVYTNF